MAENRNGGYEYAEAGWEGSGGPVGGGQPAVGHSVAGGVEPCQVAQQEAQREAQLAVRVRRLCGGAPPQGGSETCPLSTTVPLQGDSGQSGLDLSPLPCGRSTERCKISHRVRTF